jgi:metal-responsive CopG/Arc/MetJ family transcriptional regulator
VKTAISLPDELFDRITERARESGVSRSDFFARAAVRYLADLDGQSATGRPRDTA